MLVILRTLKNIKEDFLQRKKRMPADMVDWNQIHKQYQQMPRVLPDSLIRRHNNVSNIYFGQCCAYESPVKISADFEY